MAKINSRAKGAVGEREIANILKEYGYDTRRGLMQFFDQIVEGKVRHRDIEQENIRTFVEQFGDAAVWSKHLDDFVTAALEDVFCGHEADEIVVKNHDLSLFCHHATYYCSA